MKKVKYFIIFLLFILPIQSLKSDSEVGLEVDIDQEASVHEKYYYDLVSEDTEDPENLDNDSQEE